MSYSSCVNMNMLFEKLFGGSFNRFRMGQLFFIFAVTFGLFLSDTVRKILFFCSIFCMSKAHFHYRFWLLWTKEQKITGIILSIMGLWLFFIPLFFGVDPLQERLASTGWFIELALWIWAAFMFARDTFFLHNLRNFAVCACLFYSVIALCQRYTLGFVINFDNWPLHLGAWSVGTILSALLPWVLYSLITSKARIHKLSLFVLIVLIGTTMVLTLYTTFWLVIIVCIFTLLAIVLAADKNLFCRMVKIVLEGAIFTIIIFVCLSIFYENIRTGFVREFGQLSLNDFDLERFTNRRYHIWVEALSFIKERPLLGYGWSEFAKFSFEQRGNTHCAFLQAAWTGGIPAALMLIMFLLNILRNCFTVLRKHKMITIVPFVAILALSAYCTCGILDEMFRATRRIVTLYWVTFVLVLTPLLYNDDKN